MMVFYAQRTMPVPAEYVRVNPYQITLNVVTALSLIPVLNVAQTRTFFPKPQWPITPNVPIESKTPAPIGPLIRCPRMVALRHWEIIRLIPRAYSVRTPPSDLLPSKQLIPLIHERAKSTIFATARA